MAAHQRARRLLTGAIGAAGLAYPACAAICPKGRSGCPYPGHCFLYTDTDANSLCDYTSRSAAVAEEPAGTAVTAPTTAATPVSATTAVPALPPAPGSAAVGLAPVSAVLAGLAVFLVTAAAFFALIRTGRLGGRAAGPAPALAASSLLGLGAGECAASLLLGQPAYATVFAAVYLVAGTVLAAYAWQGGAVSRRVGLALSGTSALFGFAVLAPLMPIEFVGLVAVVTGGPLVPGMIGVLGGIALAAVAGRAFCGHLCPVGSAQELAYAAPVPKVAPAPPRAFEAVRLGVFVASVAAAVWSVNLLEYTGIYDFFSLTLSTGLGVFAGLLALSTVVYRPVCRALCPFGLLFSLPSHVSRLRLRRTVACVDCGRCERACPSGCAGRDASKRECYLCGRCVDVCRTEGALGYRDGGR